MRRTVLIKPATRYLEKEDASFARKSISDKARRIIEENYAQNKAADIVDKIITDQKTGKISGVNRLCMGIPGKHSRYNPNYPSISDTGCEIIAVNNALLLSGRRGVSMAELIRFFGLLNTYTYVPFTRFADMGVNPFAIGRVLDAAKVGHREIRDISEMDKPGIYILSYWNRNRSGKIAVRNGIHTVTVVFGGKRYGLLNFDPSGADRTMDKRIFEEYFRDAFIVAYHVEQVR